ncbi:hypothetical protein ACSLO9_34775, partial [Escherichia coli]
QATSKTSHWTPEHSQHWKLENQPQHSHATSFFDAGIGVFMTTADVRDVQTALMWLSGSLHAANWMLV